MRGYRLHTMVTKLYKLLKLSWIHNVARIYYIVKLSDLWETNLAQCELSEIVLAYHPKLGDEAFFYGRIRDLSHVGMEESNN